MSDAIFLKVIVVGDSGVGKTSMLNRYCYDKFEISTKPTVGCDFSLKAFPDYNGKGSIRLQLWDVAGQERFHSMSRLYVRGAFGCIIVADITNEESLKSALKWKSIVEENADLVDGKPIPIVLCQNKKDLVSDGNIVVKEWMRQDYLTDFAKTSGFLKAFQVSAKTGENIDSAVRALLDDILTRNLKVADSFLAPETSEQTPQQPGIKLGATGPGGKNIKKKKGCDC
jgi:small GTP-binding protein